MRIPIWRVYLQKKIDLAQEIIESAILPFCLCHYCHLNGFSLRLALQVVSQYPPESLIRQQFKSCVWRKCSQLFISLILIAHSYASPIYFSIDQAWKEKGRWTRSSCPHKTSRHSRTRRNLLRGTTRHY